MRLAHVSRKIPGVVPYTPSPTSGAPCSRSSIGTEAGYGFWQNVLKRAHSHRASSTRWPWRGLARFEERAWANRVVFMARVDLYNIEDTALSLARVQWEITDEGGRRRPRHGGPGVSARSQMGHAISRALTESPTEFRRSENHFLPGIPVAVEAVGGVCHKDSQYFRSVS